MMVPWSQNVCRKRRSCDLVWRSPRRQVAANCSSIRRSRSVVASLLVTLLVSGTTVDLRAEGIDSYTALETILGDHLLREDFEGISLAGGTSIVAPNPLSSSTAPPNWGIQQGVTYSSPSALALYTGQLLGDDSNILAARGNAVSNTMDVVFDTPQSAIGFYLVNITGNLDYDETVVFYHNANVLESLMLTLPSASELFMGRQFGSGITSMQVTSSAFSLVDNVTWGLAAPTLTGDYNDNGAVDAADYSAWRDALAAGSTTLTNDPTPGTVDESDFTYWRSHFGEALGGGTGTGAGSIARASVPEPSAVALILIALLAILHLRGASAGCTTGFAALPVGVRSLLAIE